MIGTAGQTAPTNSLEAVVRAHNDVVVDRLSGDVVGNRGCRVRVRPF